MRFQGLHHQKSGNPQNTTAPLLGWQEPKCQIMSVGEDVVKSAA